MGRKGTRLRTKVMRWKSMKISSFTFVLLHIANCQSTIDQSYIPYLGIIHKDESTHSVAPLVTDYTETECANYCSLRGSQFRDLECGAFFVKNSTTCHMVPKVVAHITDDSDDDDLVYWLR